MKIGFISDIHARLDALQKALALLESQRVDQILCAGDLVERGMDGDAVVELIRSLAIPCVKGNHDSDCVVNQRWMRDNMDIQHPDVRARLLSAATLDYLHQLPFTYRFSYEWMRILVVHATPGSNHEYLFPSSPAIKFRIIAQDADADVILYGHTHEPGQVKVMKSGVWFFNPGSVYSELGRGSYTCATLELPECSFTVFAVDTGASIEVPHIRV